MALNSLSVYSPYLSNPPAWRSSLRQPNVIRVKSKSKIRCSAAIISQEESVSQFDLKSYWGTLIEEIDRSLDLAIPMKYPEKICEAMRYSVLAKGAKRAPPVMCIAACELFGGNRLAAFPTACALEMVHAASLIHDDLPYMDNDTSRRGQPSNHVVHGVDIAVLAGDALFPHGFYHIVSKTPFDLVPESRVIRVIAEIARSVGSTGMAAGQFLDMEGGDGSAVEFINEKIFGEMGECSAVCGGLLAGAEDEEIERLRRYGRAVGVLYQVVDDVLDAKAKQAGERGHDNNFRSYASIYGPDKAMEMALDLKRKAHLELDAFHKYGHRLLPLKCFVDYAFTRDFNIN